MGSALKLHNAFRWVHLCAGLVAGVFLFILGLTGAMIVYEDEISRLLNHKLSTVEVQGQPLPLNTLMERLQQTYPGARPLAIGLPQQPDQSGFVAILNPAQRRVIGLYYNPYSAAVLGSDTEVIRWTNAVHQFHTHLLLNQVGIRIVGVAAIFLVFIALTGLVLWWPRKLFAFSPGASGRRLLFDLHNVTGFYSSLFLLIFALTGAAIGWEDRTSVWVNQITGSEAPPPIPRLIPSLPSSGILDPERTLAIATAAAPGAKATSLQFPLTLQNPIRVNMKYPEDHTPAGRTVLYIHPVTGDVVWLQDSRRMPVGSKIMRLWNRQIHTGDLFGWPTRLVAFVFSLALPALAITGPILWWRRTRSSPSTEP